LIRDAIDFTNPPLNQSEGSETIRDQKRERGGARERDLRLERENEKNARSGAVVVLFRYLAFAVSSFFLFFIFSFFSPSLSLS